MRYGQLGAGPGIGGAGGGRARPVSNGSRGSRGGHGDGTGTVEEPLSDSDEDSDDDEDALSWSIKRQARPPTPPRPSNNNNNTASSSRKSSITSASISTRPSLSRTVTADPIPPYVEVLSSGPPLANNPDLLSRSFQAEDFARTNGRPWVGPPKQDQGVAWRPNGLLDAPFLERNGVDLDDETEDDENDEGGGMIGRSKKFRDARNAQSMDVTGSGAWGGGGISQIGSFGFGSFGGGGGLGSGEVKEFGRGLRLGEMPPEVDEENEVEEEEEDAEEEFDDRDEEEIEADDRRGAQAPVSSPARSPLSTSTNNLPPSSYRPIGTVRSSPSLSSTSSSASSLHPPHPVSAHNSPTNQYHPLPHHSTTPHHPSPLHGSKTPPPNHSHPSSIHSASSSPPLSPRISRRRISQKSQRLSSIAGRQLPSPFSSMGGGTANHLAGLSPFSPFPTMSIGGVSSGGAVAVGHSQGGEGGYPFPALDGDVGRQKSAGALKLPPYLRDGDRGDSTTSVSRSVAIFKGRREVDLTRLLLSLPVLVSRSDLVPRSFNGTSQ